MMRPAAISPRREQEGKPLAMSLATSSSTASATTRQRALGVLRFAALEFGPLIAFWLVNAAFGIKPAIAASLLVIAVDSLWRWRRGEKFTRLYLLTSGLTLLFGAIDLSITTPFLIKYEAAVTNVAVGVAFVIGAFGEKSMIQEAAEQRGVGFPKTAELRRFFQLFTLLWAFYFFVKAAFYAWAVWTLPLTEAIALRSLVGSLSLGLMILVSSTQGRRLFFLCRALRLLPRPAPTTSVGP
jgi:intracellular septation protein A